MRTVEYHIIHFGHGGWSWIGTKFDTAEEAYNQALKDGYTKFKISKETHTFTQKVVMKEGC